MNATDKWDPIGELEALLTDEGTFDIARSVEVLDGLRMDFLESVLWARRQEIQASADRLAALLRLRDHGGITREHVVGAAAELLELHSDCLARMRPPEQDAWVLNDDIACRVIEGIACFSSRRPIRYTTLVRINAVPVGADDLRDRLESAGLIAYTFGRNQSRHVALTPAGWELVPYVFRKVGRRQMPIPPDDGRFAFLGEPSPT